MEFKDSLNEENILNDKEGNSNDINKKRIIRYIIAISILLIFIGIIIAIIFLISKKENEKNKNNKENKENKDYIKLRLKNWEFGSSKEISLSGEDISLGKSSDKFIKAPEDVYVCTAMGGLSGHTNKYYYEQELKSVDKTQFDSDWWFKSYFTLKGINLDKNLILLHINGINYKSDIYLDGKLVEKKENIIGTFIKYTLDITSFLKDSSETHYIAFKIARPHNQWSGKAYNDTDLAISFVDWNPEAPDSNMGIWQPVDIEFIPYKIPTISNIFPITKILDENKSNISFILYIKNWENKLINVNVLIEVGNFINITLDNVSLEANEKKRIIIDDNIKYPQLVIDNSNLWWPYQMGEPKLHNSTIKVSYNNNAYIYKKQIGFRQVESELIDNKRLYKINKKNLLLKGAGWTPDLFLRQSAENYYNHINYVQNMELNVIRLEGKSEGEEFYDYCDKMGILIISGWNCADAWQRWKYWSTEVERLSNISVVSQIRKLSPHPSVIIFILGSDMAPTNGIEEKWRVIFNEEKWPNEILSSAASSSGEGYPTGVKMSGPYSWVPPNYFYLNISRNETYGGAWGFLTEGGPGENPLRKGSYEKVFNIENQKNYKSDSWKYHCGNKVIFGSLDNLTNPIEERYGKIKDFEDFQKKSSVAVYEGHRAMFEAYSCYRYDSTGVIYWMLNNAWPSNIWHLYDYFFAPTPAYFASKKSGEKIHASYNYDDSYIYLLNNYFSDFNENINLKVYLISGINGKDILEEKSYNYSSIKGDEIIKVDKININYDDSFILHLEYSYNIEEQNYLYSNTYLLNKNMDEMNFSNTTFYNIEVTKYANLTLFENLSSTNLSIEIIDKKIYEEEEKVKYWFKVTNTGETIALLLELKLYNKKENENELITPILWSDNYFSIRSGESYYIDVEFGNIKSNEILFEIIGWNSEINKIIS